MQYFLPGRVTLKQPDLFGKGKLLHARVCIANSKGGGSKARKR